MARQIRQVGRVLVVVLPLLALAVFLLLPPPPAQGAPFANPFWQNLSPSPECSCTDCPCDGPPEFVGDVSVRTGELVRDFALFSTPGLVDSNVFSVRHRSMNAGATQLGARMLPSWERTLNQISPTTIEIRHPSGVIDQYVFNGVAWVPQGCNITDTLTPVGGAMAPAAAPAALGGGPARWPEVLRRPGRSRTSTATPRTSAPKACR